MALAIDASSPSAATSTTSTISTASFTPPTGSLLEISWAADTQLGVNPSAPSVTDNLGTHLTYTLRAWQSHADSPNLDGQCAIWTAPVGTSAGMTVTTTNNAGAGIGGALKVRVWTDTSGTPGVGTVGKAGSASALTIAQNYTAQATGGWGVIAVCDDDEKGTETAGTGCTMDASGSVSAANSYGFARRTSGDDTNGSTNTLNVTLPLTSNHLGWVFVEIIPAVIPGATFRTVTREPFAEFASAAYAQRDRRDANTVATVANNLPSPLDTAWQAGGRYWHLVGDAADAAPRSWQGYQPRVVSDPSLLSPTPTDPLTLAAGVGGDTWRRYAVPDYTDRREVPQQRAYVSDPSMLATALLENELLGGADYRQRQRIIADYTDRREVPQQRAYVSDPSMLATALLEGPLLGGDVSRHRGIADYADRREVPQQRAYVSDPSMLATALLENELLGGADFRQRQRIVADYADRREVPQQRVYVSDPSVLATALLEAPLLGGDVSRHRGIVDYADRREVPQQRAYVSDPATLAIALLENELLDNGDTVKRYNQPASHVDRRETVPQRLYPDLTAFVPPVVYDPLTAAWVPTWQAYNQAAIHADRREVPQQRAYISDPAFYPTTAPTDPLTVAWGDGGTYWLVYNTASLYVDRREVPQQRRYISDPGLLLTALLEGALLGGADDRWRRYSLPDYADRREVPQQRAYVSNPSLLTTALLEDALLGGDTRRQYAVADFWDRRVVPQQPVRNLPTFSINLDPLLLAWGAGGDLWHRYNPRRASRSGSWGSLVFYVVMHSCTTPRPSTGITARAASGTTSRPGTGTTSRPGTGTTTRPNTGVTEDPC